MNEVSKVEVGKVEQVLTMTVPPAFIAFAILVTWFWPLPLH